MHSMAILNTMGLMRALGTMCIMRSLGTESLIAKPATRSARFLLDTGFDRQSRSEGARIVGRTGNPSHASYPILSGAAKAPTSDAPHRTAREVRPALTEGRSGSELNDRLPDGYFLPPGAVFRGASRNRAIFEPPPTVAMISVVALPSRCHSGRRQAVSCVRAWHPR